MTVFVEFFLSHSYLVFIVGLKFREYICIFNCMSTSTKSYHHWFDLRELTAT